MDINKVFHHESTRSAIRNHAPKAILCLFFCPFRQKGVQRWLLLVQVGDMAVRAELVRRLRRHRHLHGVGVGDIP
jgi:hypothetical protein